MGRSFKICYTLSYLIANDTIIFMKAVKIKIIKIF